MFLRLTAPLRSRVRVNVFHLCLEILKTKKQMYDTVVEAESKYSLFNLSTFAEKATTRQNYRSNTFYANALRNF